MEKNKKHKEPVSKEKFKRFLEFKSKDSPYTKEYFENLDKEIEEAYEKS